MKLQRYFSAAAQQTVRETLKKETSRKTYLIDTYARVLRSNSVVLAVHNNTLLKAENKKFRDEIKKAGAEFTVVRSNLFKVALRGLEHPDPASKEAFKLHRKNVHPLASMLDGPTGIITVEDINPEVVKKVVKAIDATNSRLILLGGQLQSSIMDREAVNKFKEMPSLSELQAQLAGVLTVLGGAGLVQTLQASSNTLYLTLDEHRKNL